jgi:hypothetical protein
MQSYLNRSFSMKKQALALAFLLSTIAVPATFAHDWWEGKYEAGHHYSWDEWKAHRAEWEAAHSGERHWDEARMRREWNEHKRHYHY